MHAMRAMHAMHATTLRNDARVCVCLLVGVRGEGSCGPADASARAKVQLCTCSGRRCVPYCASRVRVRVRVRVREGVRALARAENDGS